MLQLTSVELWKKKMKKGTYVGSSSSGIEDAIQNALKKAEKHSHFEIIEARSSYQEDKKNFYQVTLALYFS